MPSTDHPDSGGAAGTTTTATDENSTSPTSHSPLPPSSSAPADTTPSHPEHNTVTESNTESNPSAPAANGETPAAADAPSTEDVTQTPEEQKDAAAEKASEGEEENPDAELEESGSTLTITLLLITGARHPFKIDGKYLRKRSVNVDNYDPFAMSVYTLKELIWREWRSDWETRPASPSSIRLISFGKLLDDKSPLSDSKFSKDAPNVVHMTVKPQEMIDEEDAKGAKAQYSRERETNERSPGCRCVIL